MKLQSDLKGRRNRTQLTKGVEPKMRGRKLRNGTNELGALKQKDLKETGVNQGLSVLYTGEFILTDFHGR